MILLHKNLVDGSCNLNRKWYTDPMREKGVSFVYEYILETGCKSAVDYFYWSEYGSFECGL